jgi:hypothetical protein
MTVAADRQFTLQFDGALTMTHHATNLDLPGEANITTAAGDVAVFQSTGANTVQCISYTKADGTAVVSAGGNKTVWLPVKTGTASIWNSDGAFATLSLADGVTKQSWATWYVPDDFSSLTSVHHIIRSNGTGNMYSDFLASATSDGGESGDDTDTIAVATYAMTASKYTFINCTAMADGLTLGADHVVGFKHNRHGGDGNDTVGDQVKPIGWVIVYA